MAAPYRTSPSKTQFLDKPQTRLVAPRLAPVRPAAGSDLLAIGKRIRYRRKTLRLTLDALAEMVGMSASALSLIETGKREAKVSTMVALASALRCDLADLVSESSPSRRIELELRLERAQRSGSFDQLKVRPVRTGPRLPLDALESLVALHARLAEVSADRDGTPEFARRANAELRSRMRASNNYFPAIEELADELLRDTGHDGGPLTKHRVTAIAEHLGFKLCAVPDLPSSTRSVTDLAHRRIFLPTGDLAAQRTLALAALGHVVLEHRPPVDYAEFLAQRVEVNYFAAAVLVPQSWAVAFLADAKKAKDIAIEDLRDRYLVSYEMAAHRFTNLATTHLDIPVHFMKINSAGMIYKAYANDGVTFPADTDGVVEGQQVCRYWTVREVFATADWSQAYQQYTDTTTGTFWCTAMAERGEHDAYSVAVGTPYEHVKWFRGRDTAHRSTSRCPDPRCCRTPPHGLAAKWDKASWPSARVHSSLLASLPVGAFPGVDQAEVVQFLELQDSRWVDSQAPEG